MFHNLFLRYFFVREKDEATPKRKSNLSDESAKVPSRERDLELLFQLLIRQSVHQGKFARGKKLI